MKTKILFLVALISVILLSSCEQHSGNLIGKFQVINKEKSNAEAIIVDDTTQYAIRDYGMVVLANSQKDTLKVYITMEEEYLNIKIGDNYLVGRNKYGMLFLNDRPEKGVIGYSKVLEKKIDKYGIPRCNVITRGQDTISVNFSKAEVVYYSLSVGDSVLVKKNRDKGKPHYFAE
jgi:hypothetical protein